MRVMKGGTYKYRYQIRKRNKIIKSLSRLSIILYRGLFSRPGAANTTEFRWISNRSIHRSIGWSWSERFGGIGDGSGGIVHRVVRFVRLLKEELWNIGGIGLRSWEEMEKYEVVRDIGSGNFGVARLMRNKATKELVAMKYIERGRKVCISVFAERTWIHPSIQSLSLFFSSFFFSFRCLFMIWFELFCIRSMRMLRGRSSTIDRSVIPT